jgi:spore maturation protein CgeB
MLLARRQPLAAAMQASQHQDPDKPVWDILALGTFAATQQYRLAQVQAVAPLGLTLFGDTGWGRLVPRAQLQGPVTYGAALARVYAGTTISLNATSLQMPTAVNQRVFDVPMAGGFCLSDAQSDLAAFFELDSEAVVYHSPEELASLVRYYAHNAQRRQDITARAQTRIVRCHTYTHRLAALCRQMAVRHRQRAQGRPAPIRPPNRAEDHLISST